jgi:hypothetical protein
MSASMENRCPPAWRTDVRQHGELLSAHKEFSLSLDKPRPVTSPNDPSPFSGGSPSAFPLGPTRGANP